MYRFAPDLSRFVGPPRRANLYTFSLNNALRYLDPDGRDNTLGVIAAASSAAARVTGNQQMAAISANASNRITELQNFQGLQQGYDDDHCTCIGERAANGLQGVVDAGPTVFKLITTDVVGLSLSLDDSPTRGKSAPPANSSNDDGLKALANGDVPPLIPGLGGLGGVEDVSDGVPNQTIDDFDDDTGLTKFGKEKRAEIEKAMKEYEAKDVSKRSSWWQRLWTRGPSAKNESQGSAALADSDNDDPPASGTTAQ
jgi:hypothetical protein